MDKNPRQFLDNLQETLNGFSKNDLNIILCSEPFVKSQFLNELIDSVDYPVIFLDFDLLYTGYVISGMISKNDVVKIYRPERDNLEKTFSEVIQKISEKKYLVILDSFNGFYSLFSEIDSWIFVNSLTMLAASVARQKGSAIVVSAMARKKENKFWVLSPGGRHIIRSKKTGIYHLENDKASLVLRSLSDDASQTLE